MAISQRVISEDHRLESEADRADGALAEHRWHWTLDDSNPKRVNFSEYARAVGRSATAIRAHASGFADHLRTGQSVQAAVQLQNVGAADRDILEATAKGLGVSVVTTRQHHKDVVSRARDAVAEAVERKPDLPPEDRAEVAQRAASNIKASRQIARDRSALERSQPAMWTLMLGDLAKAREGLTGALNLVKESDSTRLSDDFLDRAQRALDDIAALTALVRSALGGASDVDWDAELAKLGAQ